MQVLVVGKGGREHALVKALVGSPSVSGVHAIPGSAGIGLEALCHDLEVNFQNILSVVKSHQIELVVVGPEVPLAEGLADELRSQDIPVFGPGKQGAQLEASKLFSKDFMSKAGVPTANYRVVSSVEDTMARCQEFTPPFVLKADGLAAGKGVYILKDEQELKLAAAEIFEQNKFGASGKTALLEQHQKGWELSYLILTNGYDYQSLPLSQDHKRLLEGDQGPNTGGMGVVCPLNIDEDLEQQIHKKILRPTVAALSENDWDYRGILYVGIMVTPEGPTVIEYNVRFGDPEAQVVLPLLDGDWAQAFKATALGELPQLKWKPICSACIVMAAEGYPNQVKKGVDLEGNIHSQTPSSYFLHAGTDKDSDSGKWVTSGGRVLNAVAFGSSLQEAVDHAYVQAKNVHWPGMQVRKDIGQKVL